MCVYVLRVRVLCSTSRIRGQHNTYLSVLFSSFWAVMLSYLLISPKTRNVMVMVIRYGYKHNIYEYVVMM